MDLHNLQEQINKLGVDMGDMLKGEAMTPDQEQRFDRMDADRDALMRQRDRIIKNESIEKKLAESERRTEPTNPAAYESRVIARGNVATAQDRIEAVRGWLHAGSDIAPSDEMRNAAQRLGVDINRRELRLTLPSHPLSIAAGARGLRAEDVRAWEARAQGVATGGAGGFTVPDELMRALEVALLSFGGMRQAASVIRTNTGAVLPLPNTNDTSQSGVLLAENTVVAQQDVVFSQLVLDAYKYSSKLILVSAELMQDNSINLASFLGEALATRIGRITNSHFTVGTGSSQPNGIVTAATLGKTGATGQTTSVIYNDFVDMEHSVDPAYRVGAKWMFHDTTLAAIKKIRVPQFSGDLAGQPLWLAGLAFNAPDTLLGYPYVINQDMPVMAANAKSILFGSLDKYIIRDVRDITLLRLDERYADFHQVGFLAFYRGDGDLRNAGTNPVKFYANSAT